MLLPFANKVLKLHKKKAKHKDFSCSANFDSEADDYEYKKDLDYK